MNRLDWLIIKVADDLLAYHGPPVEVPDCVEAGPLGTTLHLA